MFEPYGQDCEYWDFDKELISIPDGVRTSVDMRLTFNTEKRTAYFVLSTHNDNGDTVDWCDEHAVPWDAAIQMLRADGVNIPAELLNN